MSSSQSPPVAKGLLYIDQAARQVFARFAERRDERHDRRTERREDWQEYAEDHYDDHGHGYYYGYYDGDYGAAAVGAPPFYWTLPCAPVVMAMGGVVYYVCGADWYTRAYSDGDVVYTMVPSPTGQQ